jgi:hypothetical protein
MEFSKSGILKERFIMKFLVSLYFFFVQFALFAQVELLRFDAINLCDSVPVVSSKVRPHLHHSVITKDSTKISVRLYENCGLNSKQGAIIHRNDTLILMWTENNIPITQEEVVYENGTWFHPDSSSGRSHVSCDCYVELTYVFSGVKKLKHLKVYNTEVFPKDSMYRLFNPTFEIYNGDTINYVDNLGIKRGKWILFDSLNRITSIAFIVNEYYTSEFESFEYHENGEIAVYILVRDKKLGFQMEEKYDDSGVLRERYFTNNFYLTGDNAFFEITYIEYFDEKGDLIERKLVDVQNNLFECGYFYD